MLARSSRWLFVGCLASSGAAALLYQVAWTRLLTLTLGHTVAAASTVLAAFMGGLALGAWLAGRLLSQTDARLRVYAVLEIAIAAVAVAFPLILEAFQPALAWAYGDGHETAAFAVVRVTLSLVALAVPAAAMGATYPLAAAWLADSNGAGTRRSRTAAVDASLAYAANTAGAAAGAVCAGFWLLPTFGVRATTWVGVALNIAAALGALALAGLTRTTERPPDSLAPSAAPPRHRRGRHPNGRRREEASTASSRPMPPPDGGTLRPRPLLACAVAAVSGFSALAYEVTWTRLLALVIGPTTYAFATMAASFITGIALGAAVGSRLVRDVSRVDRWLPAMLVITGCSAWLALWFTASILPLVIAHELTRGVGFESLLPRQVVTVGLLLLPSSAALGATFTLALATASSGRGAVGRDSARVYVANTFGAVAGALAAGFVLLPRLGLQGTAAAVSAFALAGGLVVATLAVVRNGPTMAARLTTVTIAAGGALLLAVVDLPDWDRELLASGAYKYALDVDRDHLDAALRAGTLEYYKEGAAATVSVRRRAGSRALVIDGKVDASDGVDMLTQRLLGLLPTLLHPRPQDVLVIGLGSGVTVGAALASGEVRRADVVEISPEVVEASAFFARENGNALQSPAVRLVIGDGRSHVELTTRRYDVIVSEPSNPWMAGVAALFTREFFEAARARLNPGGLICQWAHTYEISSRDLQSIVATFASVFPEGTMWLVGEGDLLLIGTTGFDIESRLAALKGRVERGTVPALLRDMGIDAARAPFVLLSHLVGGPAALASYGKGAPIQRDDRMELEFTAPTAMYARGADDNVAAIRALARTNELPILAAMSSAADARSWTARGSVALQGGAYGIAYESFRRATMLDERDGSALRGASDAAARLNRLDEAEQWLRDRAARQPDNVPVRVELSRVMAVRGVMDGALAVAADAVRIDTANPVAWEQLASVLADMGDGDRLASVAEDLVVKFPARDDFRYYRAVALFLQGQAPRAVDEARQVLRANPNHAKAHTLVGVACATTRAIACARDAFDSALRLRPRDPSSFVNLGLVNLEAGNARAAAGYFAEALALDATSGAAREGLARTRAVLQSGAAPGGE